MNGESTRYFLFETLYCYENCKFYLYSYISLHLTCWVRSQLCAALSFIMSIGHEMLAHHPKRH